MGNRFRFLEFLRPVLGARLDRPEPVRLFGHLRVDVFKEGRLIATPHNDKNFIVDQGLKKAADVLIGPNGGGFTGSIFRMAVGDGGVPPGDLFNPKLPDASWPARTTLYHEVLRQDIATFSKPTDSSIRFVANFNSVDVDNSSFSLADLVINEAALIIGDGSLTVGGDKKQINKSPPDSADADEAMFSTRCFKSSPFDPGEDITISITWTISLTR